MIITKKEHLSNYLGIHDNLDTAIHYILTSDLTSIPLGSTAIDEKKVFVNHFQYTTSSIEDGFIEAHRDYLDIHVALSGEEYIGYLDFDNATLAQPYNEEDDFYKVTGLIETFVYTGNDTVTLTWPKDAHQPKIQVEMPSNIDKLVFKVLIK